MSKGGEKVLASGTHGREEFVRIFFALYKNQQSGILDIHFGKKSRKLYFLGGIPIAYRSDLPEEDIGRTLSNANLIPEKQVNYLKEKLSDGENLEHAIVMSGALSAAEIAEHKRSRIQTSIGSPLLWGSGQWEFHPRPGIPISGIDPKLRPDPGSLSALWNAVQHHVSMDAVFPTVTDEKAGMIALDPLCNALYSSFGVDAAFDGLPEAVGNGSSVEEIFRQVPDTTGNLVKLLWLLEAAGLIHREGRPQDKSIDELLTNASNAPLPKAKPVADRAEPKRASTKASEDTPLEGTTDSAATAPDGQKKRRPPLTDDQLRAAHRKRMGKDFYSFLGLPPGAPKHAIDRKCKGLARRWRIPGKQRELPQEVSEKVEELLVGVQLVWRTLTDDKHRSEYDKRHEQGRAPRVGDLRGATSATIPKTSSKAENDQKGNTLHPDHLKARELMAKNKHKEALVLLKQVRVDNPSDPDIMADLGWATWNLQGAKNGDAEEFLRLAITFDDRHLLALEYLAKVLVEKGDLDTARVLIQRLMKLSPDSVWAKKAWKNLAGRPS